MHQRSHRRRLPLQRCASSSVDKGVQQQNVRHVQFIRHDEHIALRPSTADQMRLRALKQIPLLQSATEQKKE